LGEDVLKVRVYQEKVGIAHGDVVYLEPDTDSAIVLAAGTAACPDATASAPRLTKAAT
jgi:hypothetical protein